MCGRGNWSIWVVALGVFLVGSCLRAGTVDVSCNNGVKDYNGDWLQGSAIEGTGDLIQVIYAGADAQNDLPDPDGNPTDDDVLIGVTFVGSGFPINPNEGKFAKQFTDPLLSDGNVIYARAWNGPSVLEATHYGDSQLAAVVLSGGFGSVDFPTWSTGESWVAVELSSFRATAVIGGVRLSWVTESETENLGFHLHRSTVENGNYRQITEELIAGAGSCQERRQYLYDDFDVSSDTMYFYKLADIDFAGRVRFHGPVSATMRSMPKQYHLAQNYPNPFNPNTAIVFDLKEEGAVSVKIYNLQGQLVRVLVEERMGAGRHKVVWDGTDDLGNRLPSGVYMYTLEAKSVRLTRSMLFVK